ncbi:MAG: hypothetical protein E6H62_14735, partial [Betaproteobacteria bacterium]
VFAPPSVAAAEGAAAADPAIAAAGVAAFLAALPLGLAFFRADFFLAAFFAGFLNDFLLPFFRAAFLFFFFFAAFLPLLFFAMTEPPSRVVKQRTRPLERGLFKLRRKPRRIEFLSCTADSIEAAAT